MAYASWIIGTSGLTSAAGFGLTGGYWIRLPDSFPPIQFIQTTSIALPTSGDYRGMVVTHTDTTATIGHMEHPDPRQVEEYVKGDRWFRARAQPALSNFGYDVQGDRMVTRIELYYRSQSEGGQIP